MLGGMSVGAGCAFMVGLALTLGMAPAARAQVTGGLPRVWVSGHGTDQAGCGSVSAPCRSLQYAEEAVASPGEIDVLDPAGYGKVIINKSVGIINDGVGVTGVQADINCEIGRASCRERV